MFAPLKTSELHFCIICRKEVKCVFLVIHLQKKGNYSNAITMIISMIEKKMLQSVLALIEKSMSLPVKCYDQ